MKFMIQILEEELSNSKKLRQLYERELKKIPKGNVSKKEIRSHFYYYLQYRENGQLHCRYLGKLNKNQLKKYEKIRKEREQIIKNLNIANKQIKLIKKMLNDKKLQSAA